MVEEGLASLEARRHRRAVHFREDVVGKEVAQVVVAHLVGEGPPLGHGLARDSGPVEHTSDATGRHRVGCAADPIAFPPNALTADLS